MSLMSSLGVFYPEVYLFHYLSLWILTGLRFGRIEPEYAGKSKAFETREAYFTLSEDRFNHPCHKQLGAANSLNSSLQARGDPEEGRKEKQAEIPFSGLLSRCPAAS